MNLFFVAIEFAYVSAHSALPNESGCHNDAMVAWQAAMVHWNREHKGEVIQ